MTIDRLDLVDWSPPDALVDVACSKGTYVRVIAADLGERAGCGAHLAALRRTHTGGFDVARAVPLHVVEALAPGQAAEHLLAVDVLVAHLPRTDLDASRAQAFLHGQAVPVAGAPDGACSVYEADRLLGVAEVRGGLAQPRRSLAATGVSKAQAA